MAKIEYQLSRNVLNLIWLERLRQKSLQASGDIKFDCGSPIVCDDRKLRVLAEELGEVAEAVDRVENAVGNGGRRRHALWQLQRELTQLAAVSVAWLEALEKEQK